MDDQLKHMNLDDSLTEQLSRELAQTSDASTDSDEHARVEGNADAELTDAELADTGNVDADADEGNTDTDADAGKPKNASPGREKKRPILSKPLSIDILPPEQKRSMQERELSLMLKTHGRAFSQALMTIAGTPQRSGRLWMIAGATLVVIVMLIIQVYYRHRELNLGYVLSEAISQREALHEENRKLRIELRILSRRERLEPMADRQLGMTVIRPEQVLIVDEASRTRPAQDVQ